MNIRTEIHSAEKTSPIEQSRECVPCPIEFDQRMTLEQLKRAMATSAWSLMKTYGLANPERECRSVLFVFEFASYTGKPSKVKD